MLYLILVSFVWPFSFGLTKGVLTGLDSAFVSATRLSLALIVFLPFLRLRGLRLPLAAQLTAIGAIQYGVMYLCYIESFRHLAAHEVALFSLTTPLFVALLADLLEKKLRLPNLLAALLAIVAAGVATAQSPNLSGTLQGIALMQASNLAFAFGQVFYRRLRLREPAMRDHQVFALLFLGAVLLTTPFAFAHLDGALPILTSKQLVTLAYLGCVASGLCFFWWNLGATRVGTGTLAVFNNLKIPLAVACSLLVFGEKAELLPLLASGLLLGLAFWLSSRSAPSTPSK